MAKGLWRKEVPYAKAMMEGPVRTMFSQIIAWYIGINTNFSVSFGKSGRYMQQHLSPQLYQQILATYPDSNITNIWNALHLMTVLFNELANEIATKLNFHYNEAEAKNVSGYLEKIYTMLAKE